MPHVDVVIVGSGPAGSIAALTAARGAPACSLWISARFPRDKACGDLIGPSGVQLLASLDVKVPGARASGTWWWSDRPGTRAVQPALAGLDYPGYALTVPRQLLDAALRDAALDAGAEAVHGRAVGVNDDGAGQVIVRLAGGAELRGDVVIGADGANSAIAQAAQPRWTHPGPCGVSRCAVTPTQPWRMPHIVLWEPRRWRLFPGYGWIFPTADGTTNIGLGVALGG